MEPTHPRARCLRFPLTPGDAKKRKSTLEKIWHKRTASYDFRNERIYNSSQMLANFCFF